MATLKMEYDCGPMDVLAPPNRPPAVVRVFHRYREFPHTITQAINLIRQAITQSEATDTTRVVVAAAGLVATNMPSPTEYRYPSANEFADIMAAARAAANHVVAAIASPRPTVVFGVDVWASCSHSAATCGVGQFGVVLPHDSSEPLMFRKRFPTPAEATFLRVPDDDPPDPTVMTPLGRAAILVCHDLNTYSPRGAATTASDERAGWRQSFQNQVRALAPSFALHLAHWVETPGSFRQSVRAWANEVGVPLFGASQLPAAADMDRCRQLANSLAFNPLDWPVLDLCEPGEGT